MWNAFSTFSGGTSLKDLKKKTEKAVFKLRTSIVAYNSSAIDRRHIYRHHVT